MIPRDIVLVVDDSPATLGVLNEALEAVGYTVLVAQAGAAALSLVERVTPDIVLMDALMPGIDGFETCRRMKQSASLKAVPVIFMTGLTETEHVIRGLEAGGVDYVTKPVTPDEVIARIGVHLSNARLTRSAHIALDAAGRFLLAASRDGAMLWCTPQASRLIEDALGPLQPVLSAAVVAWLQRCAAGHTDVATVPLGGGPLGEGPPGAGPPRQLQLSYVGEIGPGEFLLRVVVAQPSVAEETLLRERLALTAREAEVLLWLSRGKSNRDIADILDMRSGTVTKHLEQIYIKLGVENRASAATLALRVAVDDGDTPGRKAH